MWLPLSYSIRSLGRRRARTALTAFGIAAVISTFIVMTAASAKMRSMFRGAGQPDEIVVMQAGAMNPEFSSPSRASGSWLKAQGGVAQAEGAGLLVSPELSLASEMEGGGSSPVMLRGVEPVALGFYREVNVAQGQPMAPGKRVMVGRQLARARGVTVGHRVAFEGDVWSVVGVFSARGAVYEQEIWADLDDLAAATRRSGPTHFAVRATSAAEASALVERINSQQAEPLQALPSAAAFARIGGMSIWMSSLGQFIAVVIALGAVFGGMNTMFSALASRRREIGILRAVGYRPFAILVSFLIESLLLGLSGGLLGAALAFAMARLPLRIPFLLDGEVEIGAGSLVAGLALALAVALVGGLLPSLHAARMPVIRALR